jgi:plastocyanin
MNAVEYKGSTTTEKLAPPAVNAATQSKGYVFKAPGEADKTVPQVWEIDSYALTPGFVMVQQGDTVTLQVLVVNGDKHEVGVLAPDGQVVVPTATRSRGVEYGASFVAEKRGTYKLRCATHAPTMTANILVLPR